ncbi:MAG: hypothetical protein AAGE59_13570 [Cyanobacteria bacterium P01_F01_bin.86]
MPSKIVEIDLYPSGLLPVSELASWAETEGAIVQSELSGEAIAIHYAAQWEEAGWIRLESGASKGIIQNF